jgi:HK97 family phage major capsid protein/HK97 family phage prohead protease
MTHRAYSTITIKTFDEAKRTFTGIASTPTPDRMGDVVEPKGASFKLPIPLLWQHDHADPIGWVRSAKVTAAGIEVDGEIASVPDAGPLRDRLNNAWQMMRAGLVRGLSIGFRALKDGVELLKDNSGLRFKQWEWLELSAVTIPANQEATITAIKTAAQAAPPPGVPGAQPKAAASGLFCPSAQGTTMKTLQEQLAELQAAKATATARMGEIAKTVETDGRKSFSAEERAEFDGLTAELEQIDDAIRIKQAQIVNAGAAVPVKSYLEARQAPAVVKKDVDDKFQGQSFVRMVIAKAIASMEGVDPIRVAEARYGKSNPRLVQWIKADVAGGATISGEWGTELQRLDGLFTGDFISYLYGRTLFDSLPLRTVPANVTIKGQDGASTGYWVGEGKAINVTTGDFSTTNLRPLKVAALAVISNELIRDSSPSAEMLVRDSLVEASSQKIDSTFFSNAAASSNVSPAGILNGLTAGTSAGTTAANLRTDIQSLYAAFISAKNASGLGFVMTPSLAKAISLMTTDLGIAEFPGMSGGSPTLAGDPVWTGDNVGAGDLILMKPSEIYKIGDGGVQVSVSREATIEMADNPGSESLGPTDFTGKVVSMFQTENTAIKVVRSINWAKRRTHAVRYIGDADYGSTTSWDNP